ncbi:DUF739 family protein [Aerococcus sp. JJEM-2022b]|uniref:DUF739 family protein n=1 Tax=Aerococcus mictus TaxID=2976810 RepID=UPI0018A787A9|nr:DUF739 family protein [Aerococcus mictus]MCY3080420.1 DUF739 family protein [Aerococcus mictus]
MEFDYRKLRGRIIEIYGSVKNFSKAMELSEPTMSMKLNGGLSFSQSQIYKSCELLDIDHEEIGRYFFTPKENQAEANDN